ncbi:MAG: nuclear transport factor 2 family protein [Acidobacteriaceae bacterium]|nr:nuclear transport factor 2 family protein [Acidobacteriaceae bacterium]MBV9498600.1 nuclear transport factor 2 family protein [Acidobacteriaceae bacterium]
MGAGGEKGARENILVLVEFLVGGQAVPAESPQTSEAVKEVMAIEQARTEALDHSDMAALERIMADDITYVHASGKVDTKKSYLDAIRSGQLHYLSWQPKNLQVRMLGNGAVISGEYAVRVKDSRVQSSPFDINIFVLTVYARRDGQWQQIAWQSTRDIALSPVR